MLTCNMNEKTGIHYGVIPKNDLSEWFYERWENAVDLDYENAREEIKDGLEGVLSDFLPNDEIQVLVDEALERLGEHYQGDQSTLLLKENGYILQSNNDDPDLFVIESPYYTFAPQCSPCAPNAGYLPDAANGHPLKTYCLNHDWFDGNKAPYPVFDCKTDKEVLM